MKQLKDCSEVRNHGPCIHCKNGLDEGNSNRDHVPIRAPLNMPYPDDLPIVEVCGECNNGDSKDEEYLGALIACVISGSVEVSRHDFSFASEILARTPGLAVRIETARKDQLTLWGDADIRWPTELDRAENVVVKNARGHALHELALPLHVQPSHVAIFAVLLLSDSRSNQFRTVAG